MFVKVLAINGSPRTKCNTATLLKNALEGAASQGAETELVHLYKLNFKGCISCFACKLKNGESYGRCAVNDDLTPILKKAEEADAIILGSPIYLGTATGEMRSLMERLLFPYVTYDANHSTLFKKRIKTGLIYTMNAREDQMKLIGYDQHLNVVEMVMKRIFGESESLFVTDTYQFDDFSKYESTLFNVEEKAKRRKEEFPKDCQKAFDMGVRFAQIQGPI
ncbi:MAG TPA: flavodoxin family protein [Candidatus Acidoferrales bacterium]|nr:flavodoxin family protein [Candidatus Acidoferrales bacterium]